MLSARSAGPYMPDIPMQPSPRAETRGPAAPNRQYRTGKLLSYCWIHCIGVEGLETTKNHSRSRRRFSTHALRALARRPSLVASSRGCARNRLDSAGDLVGTDLGSRDLKIIHRADCAPRRLVE